MKIQPGLIIKSTAALADTYFESATILITEANAKGATGFVINKQFSRKLNELEEFKQTGAVAIYEGGPVDQEHLFFIHKQPGFIDGGTFIGREIYFGGDFKQAINCIQNKKITIQDIKIFIGYCGWSSDELEDEINEGSWIEETENVDVFM